MPWYPQNGDGAKFAHPDDENVEVRAWGGSEVFDHDFDTSVDWYLDFLRGRGYFELISRRDATRSVTEIQRPLTRSARTAGSSGGRTCLQERAEYSSARND